MCSDFSVERTSAIPERMPDSIIVMIVLLLFLVNAFMEVNN